MRVIIIKIEVVIENGIELIKETYYCENKNTRSEYSEYYCKDHQFHRENNPAIIHYYKDNNIRSKYYYANDKLHREDGPAIIDYYRDGEVKRECYYLDGIEITDELQIMIIEGNKKYHPQGDKNVR